MRYSPPTAVVSAEPQNSGRCVSRQHRRALVLRAKSRVIRRDREVGHYGVENLNGDVDPLFEGSALHRVIAQIDVSFSNSLIEAWWRSLKHRWPFLHSLDNIATVERLVEFYGRGDPIPGELAARRRDARRQRVARNRAVACAACPRGAQSPSEHLAA
jgi:hypothetical protein